MADPKGGMNKLVEAALSLLVILLTFAVCRHLMQTPEPPRVPVPTQNQSGVP